jgi:serine protease Do
MGEASVDFMLDFIRSDTRLQRCIDEGRFDYQRAPYTGKFDKWTDCGGPANDRVVLAAMPPDESFLALVIILMASEADPNALDTILNSWQVLTRTDGG